MNLCLSEPAIFVATARKRSKAPEERDPMAVAIGARVKRAREAGNLTQREVARRSKYNEVQLSNLESGYVIPRADALARIAEALGRPIEDLYRDPAAAKPLEASSGRAARLPAGAVATAIGALEKQVQIALQVAQDAKKTAEEVKRRLPRRGGKIA